MARQSEPAPVHDTVDTAVTANAVASSLRPPPALRRAAPRAAAAPVWVVGGGVGGISAAIALAAQGVDVRLLEAAEHWGGKLHGVQVGGHTIDAGPTVLTLREVFDELFEAAGSDFQRALRPERARLLARHAWPDGGGPFDLYADVEHNVQETAARFGPRAGEAYRRFAADAQRCYAVLEHSFMRAPRPNPLSLAWRAGLRGLPDLWRMRPFATLWQALGDYFAEPRLRQLFARYATYCGASPFVAPATLMLVAHVEQRGVWLLPGGMTALRDALVALARSAGVDMRLHSTVSAIEHDGRRVRGLRLHDGQAHPAAAVIHAGDAAALPALLGRAQPARPFGGRSLSALTWQLIGTARGLPLSHHNVFFSPDYAREFDDLLRLRRVPRQPTVYLCATARPAQADAAATHAGADRPATAPEPMFMIVNAPAQDHALGAEEHTLCEIRMLDQLAACGLKLSFEPQQRRLHTPAEFARRYPATQGAIYGAMGRGWLSAFTRPAARGPLAGLYQAGGSCHPGPGVPMAALSGRLAAQALLADWASIARWQPVVATPGGTSTR